MPNTLCTLPSVVTAASALLCLVAAGCWRPMALGDQRERDVEVGGAADLHAHLIMRASLGPLYVGEPDNGVIASSPRQAWVNPFDAPSLRKAGVTLMFVALWPPPDLRAGRTAMDEALGQLLALRQFVRRNPAFGIAGSADEARRIIRTGRIALVPALEGAEAISRVDDVDRLYAAGARSIGLFHFTDSRLGDARDGQLSVAATAACERSSTGLSGLGRATVQRMFELGMVVDISHASEQTMHQIIDLAEAAGVPVVASHEGAAHRFGRTVPPEVAARIGSGGGLIGIGVYRNPIADPVPTLERWTDFEPDTCDDVIAHWLYYQRVAGDRSVMLGSDLGVPTERPLPGRRCPSGLRNTWDLPILFAALAEHGVTREAVSSSAQRLLAVWERAEARADRAAVDRAKRAPAADGKHFQSPL